VGRRGTARAATGATVKRTLVVAAVVAAVAAPPAGAASYVGSFRLPAAAEAVAMSVQLTGGKAVVALAPGHMGRTAVAASTGGGTVRFTLPGGVAFDGKRVGRALVGTVRQGALRGTFRIAPGSSRVLPALGLYRSADGGVVAIVQAQGLPTWLVELPSGDVHGLNATLTTVGARLGTTSGDGSLAVAPAALTWTRGGAAKRYTRVGLRQRELRVGKSAATLTLPPGAGSHPAVVMTHGSGPQTRAEFQVFAAFCASLGIAVIADDKRGIGQSQGAYPGERATASTVDVLAKDAEAEARYLAALPGVDRRRVGILGDSQAGWIIALAASREPAIRWAVPLVGPTVSVDESDLWSNLAGQGQSPKSASDEKMLAEVRAAGRGGFDPLPALRKLTIPVHWIFGDDDRNVPTQLCVERLQQVGPGHDFTWTVVHATHTLLELPSGLNAEIPRSRGFAATLFPAVAAWLGERRIV
jgi:pimeloyl-ACP methyl ester carboxylesterase